jgi:MFS transporter, BCD family, chlorophyll transporter
MASISVDTPPNTQTENLSLANNTKIGLFHLGSGMADVLTTGVWNRIMISDLGFASSWIGLLVALRYFLAPIGVIIGRVSDQQLIFGFRRMFWIGLGRGLMVASTFILGFTTADIARAGTPGEASSLQWGLLIFSLLLFSLGGAFSGTTFLALIYDRSSESQRGRAVGIVWTFLLVGYTVAGILFGRLLPEHSADQAVGVLPYDVSRLETLFVVAGLLFAGIWTFSMFGEEKRAKQIANPVKAEESRGLRQDLALVWENTQMRFFFFYLFFSMFFAFSQDIILEPFAADLFGMSASTTSRFSAYWGTPAILGTLFFIWYSRKNTAWTNTRMSQVGMTILLITFGLFALASFADLRWMVTPGLILLGIGLGIWNVGTLGLMMDLSPLGKAGTFLGFWTLTVTFGRGFGTSWGGLGRDFFLQFGDFALSYGVVFLIGAIGLGVSIYFLNSVNYKRKNESDGATILSVAMD